MANRAQELRYKIEDAEDDCKEIAIIADGLEGNPLLKDKHQRALSEARQSLRQKIRAWKLELRKAERSKPEPKPEPKPRNDNDEEDKPEPEPKPRNNNDEEDKPEPEPKPRNDNDEEEEPEPEPKPRNDNDEEEDKPEPKPKPQIVGLQASVGAAAKNLRPDVLLIQELLNKRTGTKLSIDGKSGKRTIGAIRNLQYRIFQSWRVDGRVDPNGKTWRWLISNKALPELPARPAPRPPAPQPDNPVVPTPIPPSPPQPPSPGKTNYLDLFLEKYGNAKHEFFDIKLSSPRIPLIGPIKFQAQFHAKAQAQLQSKRKGSQAIESQASIQAKGQLNLSLSMGLKFGYRMISVDASIEGGMRGWTSFDARTHLLLQAKGQNLTASLNPLSADLKVGVDLFVRTTAQAFGKDVGSYGASFLAALTSKGIASGNQVTWKLGETNLIKLRSPSYSVGYNYTKARFFNSAKGQYSFEIHPDLKGIFSNIFPLRYLF